MERFEIAAHAAVLSAEWARRAAWADGRRAGRPIRGPPVQPIQGPLRPHRTMPLLASLFPLWQGVLRSPFPLAALVGPLVFFRIAKLSAMATAG